MHDDECEEPVLREVAPDGRCLFSVIMVAAGGDEMVTAWAARARDPSGFAEDAAIRGQELGRPSRLR